MRGRPWRRDRLTTFTHWGSARLGGWWGHNGEGFGFTAAMFHDNGSGATVLVFMNEAQAVPKGHLADQTFRRFAEILKNP